MYVQKEVYHWGKWNIMLLPIALELYLTNLCIMFVFFYIITLYSFTWVYIDKKAPKDFTSAFKFSSVWYFAKYSTV